MCGRYTITMSLEELLIRFFTEGPSVFFHLPRYNIAPTQPVPAVVHDGTRNRLGALRWGLIPAWAEEGQKLPLMINARAETLAQKRAFRQPLERRRCLIPADSFYEWHGKQPMRIRLRGGELFAMAALYDIWQAPDGTRISSCAIVTTEANSLVAPFHQRMPVILRREDEPLWLDRRERDPARLEPLLKPYPAEAMEAYPVSRAVNNAKHDGPDCVEEERLLL